MSCLYSPYLCIIVVWLGRGHSGPLLICFLLFSCSISYIFILFKLVFILFAHIYLSIYIYIYIYSFCICMQSYF
jgi:hypothetical protein